MVTGLPFVFFMIYLVKRIISVAENNGTPVQSIPRFHKIDIGLRNV